MTSLWEMSAGMGRSGLRISGETLPPMTLPARLSLSPLSILSRKVTAAHFSNEQCYGASCFDKHLHTLRMSASASTVATGYSTLRLCFSRTVRKHEGRANGPQLLSIYMQRSQSIGRDSSRKAGAAMEVSHPYNQEHTCGVRSACRSLSALHCKVVKAAGCDDCSALCRFPQ